MAREIHIQQRLREAHLTLTGFLEQQQRHRVELHERNMLGNLIFAFVLVQVGCIHALKIKVEPFPRQKAFLETVPIAKLNKAGVLILQTEFKAIRALGPLG